MDFPKTMYYYIDAAHMRIGKRLFFWCDNEFYYYSPKDIPCSELNKISAASMVEDQEKAALIYDRQQLENKINVMEKRLDEYRSNLWRLEERVDMLEKRRWFW